MKIIIKQNLFTKYENLKFLLLGVAFSRKNNIIEEISTELKSFERLDILNTTRCIFGAETELTECAEIIITILFLL